MTELKPALLPVDDAMVEYIGQYGGRCRDCADEYGVCPSSGLPCDQPRNTKAIKHVLHAINYGVAHGYLPDPRASKARSTTEVEVAADARCKRLEAQVEQAFRDGLAYATNVVVTDADEAWRTSRARLALQENTNGG